MLDYCVIGSGISGSTIANYLSKRHTIKVFDKANGLGGRSSYKRFKGKIGFDHGLQYISPKTKEFKNFTKLLIKKRILKQWKGKHSFINNKVKENKKHIKLIGYNGNNSISKFLLKNIKYDLKHELFNIKREKNFWNLFFTNNQKISTKNLIVTVPFPQSKKLLSKFVKKNLFQNKVKMNSAITVLVITNKTNNKLSSFFTNDSILGWVSNENSKKRFKFNKDLWVLQSTFNFGKLHINKYKKNKKYYTQLLINKFKKHTRIQIKKIYFTHIHGWKYSSSSLPLKNYSYWDKKIGLGICADWFGGPRLENGWLSARDLFKKINKTA